jgi:hypothetical protein
MIEKADPGAEVEMQDTSPPETERHILSTLEEVRRGVIDIASKAARSITIMTPDLEPGIYDNEEFLEVVKRLVLAKRYARIRVLVTDPARTVRTGNSFVSLGRRLNTYIDFRNLREDSRKAVHCSYIIADDQAILYRVNGRGYDGIMGFGEAPVAQQYLKEFEQPWVDSAFSEDIRLAHT